MSDQHEHQHGEHEHGSGDHDDVHLEVIDGREMLLVLSVRTDGHANMHTHLPPKETAAVLRQVADHYDGPHYDPIAAALS